MLALFHYNYHNHFITENHMKTSQFIGTLMPSHPDFQLIIQELREKYQLPEVDPDGEPKKAIVTGNIPITNLDALITAIPTPLYRLI
jgi:hypothetical protein